MLTIWGGDGGGRRDFLRLGALGGVALADLFRARAGAAQEGGSPPAATGKSAVMIFLRGGPPHLDMWDMKPDAPVEIRGPFKPMATRVPGVQICDLMPRQAAMMDRLAIVRSITGMVNDHEDMQVMTGFTMAENRDVGRPSFGSVVSKLRGGGQGPVPQYVSLRGEPSRVFESSRVGLFPGYLGPAHAPFVPQGNMLRDLKLPPGMSLERLAGRQQLLAKFDRFRRDLDADGSLAGLDAHAARAMEVLASTTVRDALDLAREPARMLERYRDFPQLLTALRLIEAGVGCITVSLISDGFDYHIANFKLCLKNLPLFDRAIATFLEDLQELGLSEQVVTIARGEFGRDPRINDNDGGRHHWPGVMSALIAGGGLRMGQAIGSTSSRAAYPTDRPYHVQNVLATLYRVLGIDPKQTFPDLFGRPRAILEHPEVVRELV